MVEFAHKEMWKRNNPSISQTQGQPLSQSLPQALTQPLAQSQAQNGGQGQGPSQGLLQGQNGGQNMGPGQGLGQGQGQGMSQVSKGAHEKRKSSPSMFGTSNSKMATTQGAGDWRTLIETHLPIYTSTHEHMNTSNINPLSRTRRLHHYS